MNSAKQFPLATAWKIASREARASAPRFAFVVLAVAIGVGSLTGVRGFSTAFREMLLKEARTLMAADLSLRIFGMPSAVQQNTLANLQRRGVEATQITETLSMVSSPRTSVPVLVSVKAVDPNRYPFYGAVVLDPPMSLRSSLTANTAVASPDLLDRLQVHPGDTVRIGGQEFTIAAAIASEPDRISGSMNIGPRVIVSRAGLDRTGLIMEGSRSAQRFIFRLGPGAPPVARVRQELDRAFPEGRVIDYRQSNPNITTGLERATTFLSLITLIALIVGALGVGTAMYAHLQQKLDSIAIMKSLGARSAQVIRIYLLETIMLGVLGAALGVIGGMLVQGAFPVLIARFFTIRPEISLDLLTAAQGMVAGVLTTLLFTVPPLVSIRRIRPNVIFRRDMAEARPSWRARLKDSRATAVAGALIVVGVFALALWLVEDDWRDALRIASYFVGGLLVSLAAFAAVAAGLVRALRLLVRRWPWHLPPTIRHGIANVYRPGSQSPAVLTALGIGVMFTLTVYLNQRSILRQMAQDTPPDMPNVFMLDIKPQQRAGVEALLRQFSPGREPDLLPVVSAHLLSVDGKAVDARFQRTRAVTTSPDVPAKSGPAVAVSERAAQMFHIKPGSTLEWDVYGRRLQVRVERVQFPPRRRLIAMIDFVFTPGALTAYQTIWYAAVHLPPARIAALQRASYERYPTVTVVNMADIMSRIEEVVDQIAVVVRFVSLFAIIAGATILASSVAGTRFRRLREVVILKTLGATRSRIIRVFSTEFLIIGTVAGVIGSALATGFSAVLMKRLLDAPFRFDVLANVVAVLLTVLLATATGWLASYRILGEKPLEVLRNE